MTWVATFDKIGRNHVVAPLDIDAPDDPEQIAEVIYRYARTKLASRDVEVHVDLDGGAGTTTIYAGVRIVGGGQLVKVTG